MYQPVKPSPPPLRTPLAWAMYFLLVLESMSMAICLVYGIQYSHLARQTSEMRTKLFAALLIYLWIGFTGYVITIPCVCIALQKHSGKFLVPYLIWRLIFTLGTIGLGVALGVFNQEVNANAPEIRKETLEVFVPPVVIQSVLGVVFTCVAFVSFAQLNRSHTAKKKKHPSKGNPGIPVPYPEPLPGRSEIGMVHPSVMPSYYLPDVSAQPLYSTYRESREMERGGSRRRSKSLQAALNNYSPAYGYQTGWNPVYYGIYSNGNWKY